MLDKWLTWSERHPNTYSRFEVVDVEPAHELASEVRSHLVDLLHSSMFDPADLNAFAEHLGWSARELAGYRVPTNDSIKRGDFGEVLTAAMLEQFHDYEVPVQKLRRKLMGNQTLPATDILTLRVGEAGSLEEVCFVESKLRTFRDNVVAVEGCTQLHKDYDSEKPAILPFVFTELLKKRGEEDPLFRAFRSYLADRGDNRHLDTFRLSLCFETAKWREKVLENLEESPLVPSKLCVHVVRVDRLRDLTDELFGQIGFHEVSDDD